MGRYDILLQQEQPRSIEPVEKTVERVHEKPAIPSARPDRATSERANARTGERANARRIITRNSFEIYEDQMDLLRDRAFQEKREGKVGSMSAMVRDAIDQYLARAKKS
jgi:hypothetical protein